MGMSLEEADVPVNLRDAVKAIIGFAGNESIGRAADDPCGSMELWRCVSSRLGVADRNRPLLMDCISRNKFKDKPAGIEMTTWVAVLTAAEEVFGEKKVEKNRYRDAGRR